MELKIHNKLNKLAGKIVKNNQYLSLATVDSNKSNPWISPLAYTVDDNGNFYFVSQPRSKHCVNIKTNKNIAFSIFDSRQKWGEGMGLQIEGIVNDVPLKEYPKAVKLYIKRKYPYPNKNPRVYASFVNKFLKTGKLYKFYKLTPNTIWINNTYSETDERVKVSI